jgi:type IV pilus assembly protein PilM
MFFGGKKILAIDIGTSSVKLAEMDSTRKGWVLKKFGVVTLNPGWVKDGEILEPQNVAATIKTLVQSVKSKRKNVATGMFGNGVIVKRISMAPIEEALIPEAIKWEAEQYIPFDVSEAAIDHHVIRHPGRGAGDNLDIILIGAKQEFVFRFIETLESADLKCSILDVSGFALANCFEANYGKIDGLNAILNIGAGVTNLVIVENGEVVFSRDSMIGGQTYTNELHKAMGVSIPESESLKISASVGQEVPPEVNSVLTSTTEQVVDEIRNAFEFFIATGGGGRIAKIYVTGGSIFIPKLVEEISAAVGVPFEILNPFQKIGFDEKVLSSEYIQQIQSISPVAIGLALREMKEA